MSPILSRALAPTAAGPAVAYAPQRPAAPDALVGSPLRVFAVLWAFAALFHQSAYPELIVGRSALLVTLPALWLLLKPGSLPRLLAVAALQVLQVSWNGPAHQSNHWVFVFAVNLTILLAFAWLAIVEERGKVRAVTADRLLRAFAPVARVELGILYGFAVLHKLNGDFFDPAVSCATTQYAEIAGMYPVLPTGPWVDQAAIWGTLLVETLIPVLLFVRRTRLLGVVVGATFHFVLTLNPAYVFFDFTSALLAAYFLFVPFDYWTSARAGVPRRPALRWLRERLGTRRLVPIARVLLVVLALTLVGAYAMRLAPRDPALWTVLRESVRLLWVLYFVGLLAIFVPVVRRTNVVAAGRGYDRRTLPLLVAAMLPALFLLNGLSPYLGLKTDASFAMFSNLRTEGGASNHLIIPKWVALSGMQEDLVRVHASSDPDLARLGERGAQLTWFDFRTRTQRLDPGASVTYERGGVTHVVPNVDAVPELATGPGPIARRLLAFRPVEPLDRPMACRH